MQATAQRAEAQKPLTKAEQELKLMKDYVKQITKSPQDSRALMIRAGIFNKSGKLAKQYRP